MSAAARPSLVRSWRGRAHRAGAALVVGLLVPAGVAVVVGLVVAHLVPPRWTAGGMVYVAGCAKNVEAAAVTAGVVAGGLSACLAGRRRLYALVVAVAVGGLVAGGALASAPAALGDIGLLRPVVLLVMVGAAMLAWRPRAIAAAGARGHAPVVALAVGVFALLAGVRWVSYRTVDVFHDGVVLLSARAWLAGGRPFEDFLPSHGLHDFGLTALFTVLLGKVGTSPLSLAVATNAGLGAVTLFLLARRVTGGALAALVGGTAVLTVLQLGGAQPAVLVALGMLVFVAAAYCAARPGPAWRMVMAGAALAAAHLFRIDTSLYGAAALALTLGTRWLAWGNEPWRERLRGLIRDGSLVGVGAAAPLLALRAVAGWPTQAWWSNVFVILRRYHADSDGLPMPWPQGAWTVGINATLLAPVLFALVLSAAAARAVRDGWRAPRAALDLDPREALVFLAGFAVFALRTTLSRSDVGHAMMWIYLPLFGVVLLLAAPWLARAAAAPRACGWGIAVAAVLLTGQLGLRQSVHLAALRDHVAPNPPLGPCGETMLTPREAAMGENAGFVDGCCTVEHLLRAHGVERLLIDHAAPWYTVRFDQPAPSRFTALTKAFNPERQRELIASLRAAPRSAMLFSRGFRAIDRFDVDNVFRIPVAEAYLRERRQGAPRIGTPIGDLVLWDEPSPETPAPPPGVEADDVLLVVDVQTYDPQSGFLLLEGWAADARLKQRVDRVVAQLANDEEDDVRRVARPDAAAFLGGEAQDLGWSLAVRVPPGRWPTSLTVRASLADGRQRTVVSDPTRAVVLPGLSGVEWQGLAAAVDEAAAQGRADRAARVAR